MVGIVVEVVWKRDGEMNCTGSRQVLTVSAFVEGKEKLQVEVG